MPDFALADTRSSDHKHGPGINDPRRGYQRRLLTPFLSHTSSRAALEDPVKLKMLGDRRRLRFLHSTWHRALDAMGNGDVRRGAMRDFATASAMKIEESSSHQSRSRRMDSNSFHF